MTQQPAVSKHWRRRWLLCVCDSDVSCLLCY